MSDYILLHCDLSTFDGGEGGGPAGESGGAGEAMAQPAATRQASGEAGTEGAAGTGSDAEAHQPTPEELDAEFAEMVKGKYKDQYTKATQKIINRRFKAEKGLQDQLSAHQPIMDLLAVRYGLKDATPESIQQALENDQAYYEYKSDQTGLTPEAQQQAELFQAQRNRFYADQRRYQQEQAARAQYAQWQQEAVQVKSMYPDFDLNAELQDPRFGRLVQTTGVLNAYRTMHFDDLMAQTQSTTQMRTERSVTDNILARGKRPVESASSSGNAAAVTKDYSKMGDAEFHRIWEANKRKLGR